MVFPSLPFHPNLADAGARVADARLDVERYRDFVRHVSATK